MSLAFFIPLPASYDFVFPRRFHPSQKKLCTMSLLLLLLQGTYVEAKKSSPHRDLSEIILSRNEIHHRSFSPSNAAPIPPGGKKEKNLYLSTLLLLLWNSSQALRNKSQSWMDFLSDRALSARREPWTGLGCRSLSGNRQRMNFFSKKHTSKF